MYAHQVVEDLKHFSTATNLDRHDRMKTEFLINKVINSQKFHLPDFEFVDSKKLNNGFYNINDLTIFTPPYDLCWFDYPSRTGIPCEKDEEACSKRGVLLEHNKGLIISSVFNYIDIYKKWMPPMFFTIQNINSEDFSRSPILPFFNFSARFPTDEWKKIEEEASGDRIHVFQCVSILNCNNVGTKNNNPTTRINKKRRKRGKQELFCYKTLLLLPIGKKQKSIKKSLWENKIHLCRGHFKTFTEENPLFGKYSGRFWWQPSVRGNKEQGVVMKDYDASALLTTKGAE